MKKHLFFLLAAALLVPLGAGAQIELPYSNGFESDGDLTGWTTINNSSENQGEFGRHSSAAYTGDYGFRFSSYDEDYDYSQYLITPEIEADGNIMLGFWYKSSSGYYLETFAVGYSSTDAQVSSFTWLDDITAPSAWTEFSTVIPAGTKYIAIYYKSDYLYRLYVDDFTLGDADNFCFPPTGLTATDRQENSISISWTDNANEGATYSLRYWKVGDTEGDTTEVDNLTDLAYTAEELEAATMYTFAVTTICSGGSMSTPSTGTFRTSCGDFVITAPWSEPFTTTDALDCWTVIDGDGDGYSWHVDEGFAYAHYNVYGASDWAITPEIQIGEDQNVVMEWNDRGSYYNAYTYYEVLISTSGTDTGDFSTVLYSHQFNNMDYNYWNRRQVSLADYAGQSIRIAFHHQVADDDNLYIDSLVLRVTDAPMVEIRGALTADLNQEATFVANLIEGSLSGLTYAWTSVREAADDATMDIDNDTLRITYTAGTTDTITLTATNDYGSATTTFVVRLRNCEAVESLPWTTPMTSASDIECWTIIDGDNDGSTWSINSSGYLYDTYTDNSDEWAITPALVIPSDADGLILSWEDYLSSYQGGIGRYLVYASPTGSTATGSFTDTLFSIQESNNAYVARSVSLAQYAGQTIRIAFHHSNNVDDNGLRIRNVAMRYSMAPVVHIVGQQVVDVNTATAFAAVVDEGATSGITYEWTSVLDGATLSSTTDSAITITYTATGLDTLTLIATNSYGRDSVSFALRVRDLNPVTELPYSTGFEAGDDINWEITSATNQWAIGSAVSNGGTKALYVSNDGGTTHAYSTYNGSISFAYRMFTLAVGEYAVSFDWEANGESSYDFIRAFVAPGTTDFSTYTSYSSITYGSLPTGFVAIDGGNKLNLQSSWQSHTETFSISEAGNYLLVFCWRNDGGTGSEPAGAIDNVQLSALTCPRPTNLTLDAITESSMNFSWTAGGEETSWQVTVGDNAPEVVNQPSYSISDLESNTLYNVSVIAVCGEGESSFALTGSFRTPCTILTQENDLPVVENFDSYTSGSTGTIDPCWIKYSESPTATYPYPYSYTYHGNSGNSLYFYNSYDNLHSYAVMRPIDDLNGLMLTFWAYAGTPGSCQVQVGTMTDPNDPATFTVLYTTPTDMTASTWVEHEVVIPEGTAAQYLAMRSQGSNYNGIYVDDVKLDLAPACMHPASVSVSDITETTATVTINDPTNVGSYRITWTDGTTTQSEDITETSYEITGLGASTSYTVSAAAICAEDQSVTSEVSTSFYTLCAPISDLPWNENFEGWAIGSAGANPCWDRLYYNNPYVTTSVPYASASVAHNGSKSLDMYSSFDDGTGYYPRHSVAFLPQFDAEVSTLSVRFWYKVESDFSADYVELAVGVSSSVNDTTTFTRIATLQPSTTWTQYTVDLTDYTGTGIRIAFMQRSLDGDLDYDDYESYHYSSAHGYLDDLQVYLTGDEPGPVGIDAAAMANVRLYPNPATSTVNVEFEGQATVSVIDLNGRQVLSTEAESRATFDVSSLAKGAYFVRVTSAAGTAVSKLVVK